jgi:glycosyltransferase involved in cell wall biosynthesis
MLGVHRMMGTWQRSVAGYIALTKFSRQKLIEGGLPAEKIFVKSNFVDPDPGIGSGAGGYVVFVGRLSPEKGLETLLNAWRRSDGALPLKIIGDGPLTPSVKAATRQNPAIEWLGSKPQHEVYHAIGEAAALILPSQCYENFPRVVIEAFAKGTPVIASKLGAMGEIVDHGRTGLHFRAGDAADLAEKVKRILADPIRLARTRLAAREEFLLNFTARPNYEALMAIYEKAVGGTGRVPF